MSDENEHTTKPLWHGRFAEGPAAELWEYTLSLPFDQRLARFDIHGCRAHVAGLGVAGILSASEVGAVEAALDTTEAELASGEFTYVETDEDIHTAVERRGPRAARRRAGRHASTPAGAGTIRCRPTSDCGFGTRSTGSTSCWPTCSGRLSIAATGTPG
ncbi:MAG: hypothetical protein V9G12_04830 [Microthrixaceae bacterium]